MSYSRIDRDICHLCFKQEYVRIDQIKFLHRSNVKKKNEKENICLNFVPKDLWVALFEKLDQKSFVRIRRSNKTVSTYIDQHRNEIRVNLFHNWTIGFILKDGGTSMPYIMFKAPQEPDSSWPGLPVVEEIYKGKIDQEAREVYIQEKKIEARRMQRRARFQNWKSEWNLRTRPLRNIFSWIGFSVVSRFSKPYNRTRSFRRNLSRRFSSRRRTEEEERQLEEKIWKFTYIRQSDHYRLYLNDWKKLNFLQKEFKGSWHPSCVFVESHRKRENMDTTGWDNLVDLFLSFCSSSGLSHCYLRFHDLPYPDIIQRICNAFNPIGLYITNPEIYPNFVLPQGFFKSFKSLRMISLLNMEQIDFDDLRELLPQLEIIYITGWMYEEDKPFASPEGTEFFVKEAIQLWKLHNRLIHLRVTLSSLRSLLTTLTSLGAKQIEKESLRTFYSEHSTLKEVCDERSNLKAVHSEDRKRLGTFFQGTEIVFHSLSVSPV